MSLKIYSLRQAASSICQYVDNVFLTDEDFVCEIIKNFTLEFGSGSPQSDLKKLLADNPFVPPDLIDDVDSHLQGWVKKKIDLLLEQKRIAIYVIVGIIGKFLTNFTVETPKTITNE